MTDARDILGIGLRDKVLELVDEYDLLLIEHPFASAAERLHAFQETPNKGEELCMDFVHILDKAITAALELDDRIDVTQERYAIEEDGYVSIVYNTFVIMKTHGQPSIKIIGDMIHFDPDFDLAVVFDRAQSLINHAQDVLESLRRADLIAK